MSLYNMLFGVNQATPVLLKTLGLSVNDVPRLRDCYIDGNRIAVYTRTGGGNRDYYDEPNDDNKDGPWNSDLQANPNYLFDEDDDFDSTYATFYFKFPAEYEQELKAAAEGGGVQTPSEKWQLMLESLKAS